LKGTRPRPPENLSIYYPISPQRALLLADIDEQPLLSEDVTAAQASMLNGKLFDACYKQLFAQSEGPLHALKGAGGRCPEFC
jgi:hypothetical protein